MAVDPDKNRLARVFGAEVSADTLGQYALRSTREFVRSQDQLAEARPGATGRRLTAWEAYRAFGLEKLEEVLEYGSAIIVSNPREPAATIRQRREILGLDRRDVARALGLSDQDVENAEDPKQDNSIHVLERVAQALALEESRLSTGSDANTGERLAVRLRQIRNTQPEFTPRVVLAFDEAAWVTLKQNLLSNWLSDTVDFRSLGFETDSRYGDKKYPAWQFGYELARHTRKLLGIEPGRPIESLRDLIESRLTIPLVHLSLPQAFAGATIAVEGARGIAINTQGLNGNVWVRRSTMAHELGHLLWDPDQRLQFLRVDSYVDIEKDPSQRFGLDPVEARANAFAIELLAPQEYVLEVFRSYDDGRIGLRAVMEHFGVSFISARYQLWNALERTVALDAFAVDYVEPTDDWKGRESFTNDYFKPATVAESRRGRFAYLVVKALKDGFISLNSAASFLGCSENELKDNVGLIESFFARQNGR